jgi:CheY-like chemotaxis protein
LAVPKPSRRVLIIEDQPSVRNVLYVLLAGIRCDGEVVCSSRQALERIQRESFDALLLDLRCSEMPPGQIVSAVQNLQPSLLGRVLVITGEVADPRMLEEIENLRLPRFSPKRLAVDLRAFLCSLF